MAQLVERPTEKPGAILTRVRVPGAARDFFIFIPESAFSADSLTVSIKPSCSIACISIGVYDKNPKQWQLYCCLDTRTLLHTLIGMSSAALAPTVPYPDTATRVCPQGTKKYLKKKKKNVCNCMRQHPCPRKKSQTLAAMPLFGQAKRLHSHSGRNG